MESEAPTERDAAFGGRARGLRVALALCCALGCASGPLSALRFQNHEPIWRAEDRQPVPRPEGFDPGVMRASAQALVQAPPMYALSVPQPQLAHNINALGEVPDSTWFENRIGVREMSAREVFRGPNTGGPDRSAPLSIVASKVEGTAPGFIVQDARGDRYIVKFDPVFPETESGAEVVVQRLLWAAGYFVPENDVIDFARDELVIAQDAELELADGSKRPLTQTHVDIVLSRAPTGPDGKVRALASKFLAGKPIGGYPMSGVRADDPNDRYPHEHRRDVRGQRVFFAWLGHTDVKEKNTLDMWIEQPQGSGRGYVKHYLLDFGKALGVWGRDGRRESDGYAPYFDYGYAFTSLVTLGLWERPWEGVRAPQLRGVGRFEASAFDPSVYSPANPYVPFLHADRFDAFWAAKIIGRFRPEHIAAAVDAARYSERPARDYLVRTILARQRKTLAHWFREVTPLDRFVVETRDDGVRLCALDLSLAHGLAAADATHYRVRVFDDAEQRVGWVRELDASPRGALCVDRIEPAKDHDAYTLVVFETFRAGDALPPVIVHLARNPANGYLRVVGLERQ